MKPANDIRNGEFATAESMSCPKEKNLPSEKADKTSEMMETTSIIPSTITYEGSDKIVSPEPGCKCDLVIYMKGSPEQKDEKEIGSCSRYRKKKIK